MKIAYCIESMYNAGGMERVLTVCANILSDVYCITIVTAFQEGRLDNFHLSPQVRRHDLGISENIVYSKKKHEYKKRLTDFLEEHHFDFVVSLGGIDLDFLHSIRDGSKKLVWFHFAIDIVKTTWIGPNPNFIKKVKAQLRTWKRIYYARKYDKIVVISKADLEAWKEYTNKVVCVYNPVTINASKQSDCSAKAVISVGRLCYQKGFDFLIDAWKLVVQKYPDWYLNIYGEGGWRNELQKKIESLGLSNVIKLRGRCTRMEDEFINSSMLVMSSRAEGFPLILLEAASCGLPLISYDCPSGPSEIVTDGENGYLIPHVGDIDAMAEKICLLIENAELRKQMGEKAKLMVDKFSPLKIKEQWMTLFDSICQK